MEEGQKRGQIRRDVAVRIIIVQNHGQCIQKLILRAEIIIVTRRDPLAGGFLMTCSLSEANAADGNPGKSFVEM